MERIKHAFHRTATSPACSNRLPCIPLLRKMHVCVCVCVCVLKRNFLPVQGTFSLASVSG